MITAKQLFEAFKAVSTCPYEYIDDRTPKKLQPFMSVVLDGSWDFNEIVKALEEKDKRDTGNG